MVEKNLNKAIDKAKSLGINLGPGRWEVQRYRNDVYLVYIWDPGERDPYVSEHLWHWGGDRILDIAGFGVREVGSSFVRHRDGRTEHHGWILVDPPDDGDDE